MKTEYSPQNDGHSRSYFRFYARWLATDLAARLSPELAKDESEHCLGTDWTRARWCTWPAAEPMTSTVKCSKSMRSAHAAVLPDEWCRLYSAKFAFDIRDPSTDPEWLRSPDRRRASTDRTPKRWYPHDRWTIDTHRWMEIHATLACEPPECLVFPQYSPRKRAWCVSSRPLSLNCVKWRIPFSKYYSAIWDRASDLASLGRISASPKMSNRPPIVCRPTPLANRRASEYWSMRATVRLLLNT